MGRKRKRTCPDNRWLQHALGFIKQEHQYVLEVYVEDYDSFVAERGADTDIAARKVVVKEAGARANAVLKHAARLLESCNDELIDRKHANQTAMAVLTLAIKAEGGTTHVRNYVHSMCESFKITRHELACLELSLIERIGWHKLVPIY